MEMTERETRDFMNVDSFSQLPFIRPSPAAKEKSGIRLFGIDFDGKVNRQQQEANESMEPGDAAGSKDAEPTKQGDNRRFECHYCCRNFPTSQALGGHQNAHKRERQHAKKAHLQSAAAMIHQAGFPSTDSHSYGLVNYGIGSYVPSSVNHGHASYISSAAYPSWNSNVSTSNGRLYGTHHSQLSVNGNTMMSWRMPPPGIIGSGGECHRDRSMIQPVHPISNEESIRRPTLGAANPGGGEYGYPRSKPSVKDHVSLDLHL